MKARFMQHETDTCFREAIKFFASWGTYRAGMSYFNEIISSACRMVENICEREGPLYVHEARLYHNKETCKVRFDLWVPALQTYIEINAIGAERVKAAYKAVIG